MFLTFLVNTCYVYWCYSIGNTSLAGSTTGIVEYIGGQENLNKIAGSALGVVGNIARWGNLVQIQVTKQQTMY